MQYLRPYSRLGILLALIWLIMNRPFGRHVFITQPGMVFTTLMLPDEMRHPTLALAGSVRRGLRANLSGWVVLGVLAVEIYRAIPQA
jgi:hypothetical protein